MSKKLCITLFAAGAMIPVFGQNVSIERAPGDGPVHPNEPVCILATMAHPDDQVQTGDFTVQHKGASDGYVTSTGGGSVVRLGSSSAVKICGSLNANAPSGSYEVKSVDLVTRGGKTRNSVYPTDFRQLVSFEFVNEVKDVPTVTDVKRVPAQ